MALDKDEMNRRREKREQARARQRRQKRRLMAALVLAGLLAGRLARRITDPLNDLDLDHPLDNASAYEKAVFRLGKSEILLVGKRLRDNSYGKTETLYYSSYDGVTERRMIDICVRGNKYEIDLVRVIQFFSFNG